MAISGGESSDPGSLAVNLTLSHWFFRSDEEKSTSWVHPGTNSPIQSGYCSSPGKESPAIVTFAVNEETDIGALVPRPALTSPSPWVDSS